MTQTTKEARPEPRAQGRTPLRAPKTVSGRGVRRDADDDLGGRTDAGRGAPAQTIEPLRPERGRDGAGAAGEEPAATVAPPGLKGLVVADTRVGAVRGAEGFYHYRGQDAAALAEAEPFEAVAHLLLEGRMPKTAEERDRFGAALGAARARAFGRLGATRTLRGSLAEVLDDVPTLDQTPALRRAAVLEAVGALPVLVAALHRRAVGRPPVAPDPALGHAEDFLRMVHGRPPSAAQAEALGTYLALTLDHGMNASTFTVRVITSTGASVSAAMLGGLAALSGPLHGGAPGRVLEMLEAIGGPEDAPAWAEARLAEGAKLMGFGHAVYRAEDPRSRTLARVARRFEDPLVARAAAIEEALLATLRAHKPGAAIVTNVEYWAGVVLHLSGLPRALFTPTFAVSRAFGWGAHLLEEAERGKILRPSARYVGSA